MTHASNNQSANLDHIFTYHAPNEIQTAKFKEIRDRAYEFCNLIVENTPSCADQSAAIRKVREAVMLANAAIALEEEKVGPV